jgi:acetyl-CoA carboxylase biotin carboxyl carrier protein
MSVDRCDYAHYPQYQPTDCLIRCSSGRPTVRPASAAQHALVLKCIGCPEYEVKKAMTLSSIDISEIVRALQDTDWNSAEVSVGDVSIALARNGAGLLSGATPPPASAAVAPAIPAPAPAPPAAPASGGPAAQPPATTALPAPTSAVALPADRQPDDVVVSANSVGVFWAAPEPGAEAFVKVGDTVQEQDVMCIVEIMKLMSHVHAGVNGVVVEVLATDGQAVENGAPLFVIRPQEA